MLVMLGPTTAWSLVGVRSSLSSVFLAVDEHWAWRPRRRKWKSDMIDRLKEVTESSRFALEDAKKWYLALS